MVCCCSTIGRERHYDLTLENQHGDAIVLDKGDQESLVMGMSLYDKGKISMNQVQPSTYTQPWYTRLHYDYYLVM